MIWLEMGAHRRQTMKRTWKSYEVRRYKCVYTVKGRNWRDLKQGSKSH